MLAEELSLLLLLAFASTWKALVGLCGSLLQ